MALKAGAATRVINCEIGDDLCGQLHRRICEGIRDDLEANVLYLADDRRAILLINLDLIGLCNQSDVPLLRETVAAATTVAPRDVVITSTHTHDGPDMFGLLYDTPPNTVYLEKLRQWLADAAAEAVASARPAKVGWAMGRAHIGYNRRCCWQDGSHTMYGDPREPTFTGLEGPDDPGHAVLAAVDTGGELIGVVHNNCCHATCMESITQASADFPGGARRQLRGMLDKDVPVLYLQGASGDTSPWDLMAGGERDREARLVEVGRILADQTARLLDQMAPTGSAVIENVWEDIPVPIRLPDEQQLARAREIEAMGEEKAGRGAHILAVSGAIKLYETFKDNPTDIMAAHAIRIGELAIATNPCEMYCRFGRDLKARSPAAVTMVSQLTDGFCGYCPTIYAIRGGGYSGDPTFWTRLEPAAGYKWVDTTARLLHSLWP